MSGRNSTGYTTVGWGIILGIVALLAGFIIVARKSVTGRCADLYQQAHTHSDSLVVNATSASPWSRLTCYQVGRQ